MLAQLMNIGKVPDLRKRVVFTLLMILVYRVGAHVPTPFINPEEVKKFFGDAFGGGGVLSVVDMFSGGAFSQMTIFALGIMPYISASIIIQLMTAIMPQLEKIAKEGAAGQKKITQWTRYFTVALSFFQGLGLAVYLYDSGLSGLDSRLAFYFITALSMCTGTCFIMWLGEKITEHGIGNGISLIITVGIIARYPIDFAQMIQLLKQDQLTPIMFLIIIALGIFMAAVIVFQQQASRRIPIQHARQQVGRQMIKGGNSSIPLKLNTANVIPVIFSSAILTAPTYLFPLFGSVGERLHGYITMNSTHNLYNFLGMESGMFLNLLKMVNFYTIAYVILTAVFCFFYTAITLNPVDVADNLKKSGAFVPGIKPGKQTADYIDHILVRITVVGALFLIVIALVPDMLYVSFDVPYAIAQVAGGTGLIIVVGVMLDTMMQIEAQLRMRHFEGFGTHGKKVSRRTRTRQMKLR